MNMNEHLTNDAFRLVTFPVCATTSEGIFRDAFDDLGISQKHFKSICRPTNWRNYQVTACLFEADALNHPGEGLEDVIIRLGCEYKFLRFLTPFELLCLQIRYPNIQKDKPVVTNELGLGASSYATFMTCGSELLGKTIAPLAAFRRGIDCPPALVAMTMSWDLQSQEKSVISVQAHQ